MPDTHLARRNGCGVDKANAHPDLRPIMHCKFTTSFGYAFLLFAAAVVIFTGGFASVADFAKIAIFAAGAVALMLVTSSRSAA